MDVFLFFLFFLYIYNNTKINKCNSNKFTYIYQDDVMTIGTKMATIIVIKIINRYSISLSAFTTPRFISSILFCHWTTS